MNLNYLHLIYLIRSSLGENININKLKNINFQFIYQLSNYHKITNLICYGIDNLKLKIDSNLYQKFKQNQEQLFITDIMQQEECKIIIEKFKENNINFLLLKGIKIKNLYPKTDMRTMGDIDILIKESNRSQSKLIMEELGYNIIKYKKDNEDVYQKLPIHNIEIHTELFERKSLYYHYYKNAWKKFKFKTKDSMEYMFSNEDFYIFLITHFAKHYFHIGAGIRNIIDIYLIQKEYKDTLNKEYINVNLKKLDLDKFEKKINELIKCWFYDKKPTKEIIEMSNYIIESGLYGKEDNFYNNKLKRYKTKKNYLFHRIFLPIKEMKNHYPILNKIIILLPLFWLFRIMISIIRSPKNIIKEIQRLLKK